MTFFFVIASFRTDWALVAIFILIDVALMLLAYGPARPAAARHTQGGT
jgi:succinate-acetate transporter protein